MSRCDTIRPLIPRWAAGELEPEASRRVDHHIETCEACRRTADAARLVHETGMAFNGLEPPADLAARLTASPCSRWLSLLHRAADRELESDTLARLLQHMEDCSACRRTWDDLTLIHQVGEAMQPPRGLVERCIARRDHGAVPGTIFGVRTATAAAYFLAVLTTVLLGNPVSLARRDTGVVHRARIVVRQRVADVADDSRGEVRVILWRTWKWGEHQVDAIRDLLAGPPNDHPGAGKAPSPQGEER